MVSRRRRLGFDERSGFGRRSGCRDDDAGVDPGDDVRGERCAAVEEQRMEKDGIKPAFDSLSARAHVGSLAI